MGRKSVDPETRSVVVHLIKEGKKPLEVAKTVSVSHHYVKNIILKLNAVKPLRNEPGQGRRRLTTPAEDRYLMRICKQNRTASSRMLAGEWSNATGKQISARTVRRRLYNGGLYSYTQKRCPYRNNKQIRKRLEWCRKHADWNQKQWNHVAFSDESHFEVINRKNRVFVRRTAEECDKPFSFQTRQQGGGGTVSVWGCISAAGVGPLVPYEGRLQHDILKPFPVSWRNT